jgi:hypothetical protein
MYVEINKHIPERIQHTEQSLRNRLQAIQFTNGAKPFNAATSPLPQFPFDAKHATFELGYAPHKAMDNGASGFDPMGTSTLISCPVCKGAQKLYIENTPMTCWQCLGEGFLRL